jgi:hypothetical protein
MRLTIDNPGLQPLSAEQQAAYRRLAMRIVGADVETLLAQSQERRAPATYVWPDGPQSLADGPQSLAA